MLCYCLPVFGGCTKSDLNSLQIQQNRATQIVLNLSARSNRDSMLTKLEWLTVNQLIVYHTLITVFKVRQTKEPEYLAKCLCRESRVGTNRIIVENPKLELVKKSFTYRGSVQWNSLP